MKTLILIIAIMLATFISNAQEVGVTEKRNQEVSQSQTVNEKADSVKLRVGKYNIDITDKEKGTNISIDKIENFNSRWEMEEDEREDVHVNKVTRYRSHRKFDGHWSALELGGNVLYDRDYSMYPDGTPDFMETQIEKSLEFNWNFVEYDFGFCSYIGIVTGLGINWNNYKFSDRITLTTDEAGVIQPVSLPAENYRKSKLTTVYLTAPLMFEIQIPGQSDRMFIAGGVIGGLKIGDYTKYKIGKEKYKDKGDYNLNPLRWGYTARIGFDDIGVYGTYYNVNLFKEGMGPALTPFTVGITFTFD